MSNRAIIEKRRNLRRPYRLLLRVGTIEVTGLWRVKQFDVIQDWRRLREKLGIKELKLET